MASVQLANNGSSAFSFEATILNGSGSHITVRALVPAGGSKVVPLPSGVTVAMLAEAPEVKAEMARPSPRYAISVAADPGIVEALADGETFSEYFNGPLAAGVHSASLGVTQFKGKLGWLRVTVVTAGTAGDQAKPMLNVNGVAIAPPGSFNAPVDQPAYDTFVMNIADVIGDDAAVIEAGKVLTVDLTIVGGTTIGDVYVDLFVAKSLQVSSSAG